MLNALVIPTTGRVTVDGLDTARDARSIRRRVGFCFTDPDAQIVMPTVQEDLAFSLRRHGLPKPEVARRVEAAIMLYGLAAHRTQPAHLLSGGQKQLLALAAVLLTEPALVVMDEPTTLLDVAFGARSEITRGRGRPRPTTEGSGREARGTLARECRRRARACLSGRIQFQSRGGCRRDWRRGCAALLQRADLRAGRGEADFCSVSDWAATRRGVLVGGRRRSVCRQRSGDQVTVKPPSTITVWPHMYAPASEASQSSVVDIWVGVPSRPSRVRLVRASSCVWS
ncbi:ATP-binding cassette domain-containing protein [Intrasporangium chromatireducens]